MEKLQDKFGRGINYLRLSVTDRCNLRCTYCMPERGMVFEPKEHLLSYEELLKLVDVMGEMGINKIRLTGGEPFVRADLMYFIKELSKKSYLDKISITSNLTLIRPHLDELVRLGVKDINVSLDCLDRQKFKEITRRDEYEEVSGALHEMIARGFNLKVNCVVMQGVNEDQILPLIELAKEHPVSVRFLEEMPFNGSGGKVETPMNYKDILSIIEKEYDYTKMIDGPHSTSQNYQIVGFKGSFGVIPSFSRTFCGDCNRLRMSATGEIRTCLYGHSQLNLKEMLRSGATTEELKEALMVAVANKPKDGFAAAEENEKEYLSMTKLGG
ncbi:cyclic pyranopterin monophosphate synthase subunit MoaA [Ekhidna lutea]|uniref:GTP 3',8-cyclase n=1 Tax=Ekhidna lutea TaxID=447679 RepID=A0A239M9C4_EKHLU|nr:GTP 3',8-cyclase MoaA [Ekhidna lutea]SNT39557.1 cyclic pyranopterin monophosphate synthase subunit MoaA [Ekhidna lutea]